jgi:GNAT superfamily N-acetyltransferase
VSHGVVIRPVRSDELAAVRTLLGEYAATLPDVLGLPDFEVELQALPGVYAPPRGALLVAVRDDQPGGMVAMRPFESDICEMKRLYLRPALRGTGAGRSLVAAVIQAGRDAGYRRMRLDTLPTMPAARRLYAEFGFQPIPPYGYHPVPGTAFLELAL